jgi:hypothetical protein
VNAQHTKAKDFGGTDPGDERAAILDASRKPLIQFLLEDSVKEFDFRQYLFARQALVLFLQSLYPFNSCLRQSLGKMDGKCLT